MTELKNDTQAVMCLHSVARYVENQIGTGALSLDIRRVADRLHEITNKRQKNERTLG